MPQVVVVVVVVQLRATATVAVMTPARAVTSVMMVVMVGRKGRGGERQCGRGRVEHGRKMTVVVGVRVGVEGTATSCSCSGGDGGAGGVDGGAAGATCGKPVGLSEHVGVLYDTVLRVGMGFNRRYTAKVVVLGVIGAVDVRGDGGIVRCGVDAALLATVVGTTAVDVVGILLVKVFLEFLRLVEVKLLLGLGWNMSTKGGLDCMRRGAALLTIPMVFHSRERIFEISPVRIIWFAALTCGRRRRAKIMKAFMGRFGVPSALRACERSEALSSSGTALRRAGKLGRRRRRGWRRGSSGRGLSGGE